MRQITSASYATKLNSSIFREIHGLRLYLTHHLALEKGFNAARSTSVAGIHFMRNGHHAPHLSPIMVAASIIKKSVPSSEGVSALAHA